MNKISLTFFTFLFFTSLYSLFLHIYPLSKRVFYTNEERIEEFLYSRKEVPIVLVGSSLSGAFEGRRLFDTPYFNLFLPFAGGSTGLEIIRKSNRFPKILFFETNHSDRAIDSNLLAGFFKNPFSELKNRIPFLLKKNKLLNNVIDRLKQPVEKRTNIDQPPALLYASLLAASIKEWAKIADSVKLRIQLEQTKENLKYLTAHGTKICFYEVPMDSNITNSSLLAYQRSFFQKLAKLKGYSFINVDKSRSYKTGDGIHLLETDSEIYTKYFLDQVRYLKLRPEATLAVH